MDYSFVPHNDVSGSEFVHLLTSFQRDLYLYIRSLVLATDEVEEIVQNTNLLLWEKQAQFDPSKDFRPWAFQIARYKVSEYLAQRRRKGICFSDAVIDELALKAPQYALAGNDFIDDFRRCVEQLTVRDRDILNQRYSKRSSCANIAKEFDRPVPWIYKALNRIRQELADCMARYHHPTRRQP